MGGGKENFLLPAHPLITLKILQPNEKEEKEEKKKQNKKNYPLKDILPAPLCSKPILPPTPPARPFLTLYVGISSYLSHFCIDLLGGAELT